MSPERDDELDKVEGRVFEHDRRLLTIETGAKVVEAEVNSLRASRHEHGNWLNRHNLEMQELNLKVMAMTTQVASILSKTEQMRADITALTLNMSKDMSNLRSDLRQTMWTVSVIVAVAFFVIRAIANKYGF